MGAEVGLAGLSRRGLSSRATAGLVTALGAAAPATQSYLVLASLHLGKARWHLVFLLRLHSVSHFMIAGRQVKLPSH